MTQGYYDRKLRKNTPFYKVCLYCEIGTVAVLMLLSLMGCRTVKSEESTTDRRFVTELNAKMDSLMRSTSTWQETFLSRQTSLVDSLIHRERNDSSHSVVVNEKGDTVRERIEVIRYIEREHKTNTKETEQWIERFRQTDSLLHASLEKQERTDSMLQEYTKNTVTEKQLSLWERIKVDFGGYALIAFFFIFIVVCFRTVRWLRRQPSLKG